MRATPNLISVLAVAMLGALLTACAAPSQLGQDDRGRIAGRTFVVTGASSGVGRGVALRLASYGANVVLAARRAEVLDEVAAQARAAGGQPLVVPPTSAGRTKWSGWPGLRSSGSAASTCGSTTPPWPRSGVLKTSRWRTTRVSST